MRAAADVPCPMISGNGGGVHEHASIVLRGVRRYW